MFNLAKMSGKCAESLDTTPVSRKPVCLNPVLLEGRPHGWLCKDHAADEDTQWRLNRDRSKTVVRDLDAEQVAGIIVSEARAIANGKVVRTRYGSLEPAYFRTWAASQKSN